MGSENPELAYLRTEATAAGEIVSADANSITIEGSFTPGIVIPLHPGQRVLVFTEDEAFSMFVANEGCGCDA